MSDDVKLLKQNGGRYQTISSKNDFRALPEELLLLLREQKEIELNIVVSKLIYTFFLRYLLLLELNIV